MKPRGQGHACLHEILFFAGQMLYYQLESLTRESMSG